MKLDFTLSTWWIEQKRQVMMQLNDDHLPLVLFGYTKFQEITDFLNNITVPYRYLCDNDPQKLGKRLYNCEVIAPDDLKNYYEAGMYNILILVPFFSHQIIPQLQLLVNPPKNIYQLDFYFDAYPACQYIREYQTRFEQVYNILADDQSRNTYEAVVNYWIGRNKELLAPVVDKSSKAYFPGDLFTLGPYETFLDAGAFTGDTVMDFVQNCQGRYKAIYTFEPLEESYLLLKKNTAGLSNVYCFPIGVSDRSKEVSFSSDMGRSKEDQYGDQMVKLEVIDALLPDTTVTYLKMDIEGAEYDALNGARNLIRRCHPKLAICTYHSIQDMCRIPLLIHEISPDYKLYFRHYSNSVVDTVCYAL